MSERNLTPKQAKFVEEYLLDLNATKAAIRAGYSAKTAEWIGPQLLGKTHVAKAIEEAMAARSLRTQINADWLLKRLAAQADADIADLYREDGTMKLPHEWPEVWRKGLVAGLDVLEEFGPAPDGGKVLIGYTKKLRLADRTKTLELIGRHVNVGAWREKLEVTGKDGGPILTRRAEDMTDDELARIASGATK